MKAEPWESDEEFAERQKQARAEVESEKAKELREREAEHERSKQAQVKELEEKLASAIKTLESKSWTLAGSDVTVTPGEFGRDTKKWPFFVESNVPEVPFKTMVVKDLSRVSDLRTAYSEIDNAIKAGALAGEIEWSITVLENPVVKEIAIKNEGRKYNEKIMRLSGGSKEKEPPKDYGNERNTEKEVTNKKEKETIHAEYSVIVKAVRINNITDNEIILEDYKNYVAATFEPGKRKTPQRMKKIGENYAGGIVFYLDGKGVGLVAAPRDQSDGIDWGGSGKKIGNTSTAVGTGAANTRAIVAKLGNGNYAAKLCADLTLNGYDDWFLPSKDELELMYKNLHKQGGGGFAGGYYWSSSESSDSYAWKQRFGDGYQSKYGKAANYRVRAVRAF